MLPASLGDKVYELKDHLGNVRITLSDVRLSTIFNSALTSFRTEVVSMSDYYAFGMLMVGRNWSAGEYRYGFNGQENTNEVAGVGNFQDYGMRDYDPRLCRFVRIDPLTDKYPFYSGYQFASNTPITAVDIDGLESDKTMNEGVEKPLIIHEDDHGFIEVQFEEPTFNNLGFEQTTQTDNCEDKEVEDSQTVGKPSTLESMIPIWGSGREAVYNYQKGNYFTAGFYTAMAVSDVFLVKSIATGVAKGGLKAIGKNYITWGSWRKFYGNPNNVTGVGKFFGVKPFVSRGQHLHHWAFYRNGSKRGTGFLWNQKKQMWNLMPMKPSQRLGLSGSQIHSLLHNGTVTNTAGQTLNWSRGVGGTANKFIYGTPTWFKSSIFSFSSRIPGIIINLSNPSKSEEKK